MSEMIDPNGIRSVTPHTELIDIRPMEMIATVINRPPEAGKPIQLSLQSSIRLERSSASDFSVAARFVAVAREEREEQPEFVRFVYSAAAKYKLAEGVSVSDEELQPFARYNSMVHLWPYFRTFVQSSCGQLMLPPIMVPVFRIPGAAPEAQRHHLPDEGSRLD